MDVLQIRTEENIVWGIGREGVQGGKNIVSQGMGWGKVKGWDKGMMESPCMPAAL